jgi:hypothetical protein
LTKVFDFISNIDQLSLSKIGKNSKHILMLMKVIVISIRTELLMKCLEKIKIWNGNQINNCKFLLQWVLKIFIKTQITSISNSKNFIQRAEEFFIEKQINREKTAELEVEFGNFDDFQDEISEDEDLDDITNRHNCFILKSDVY